MSEYFDHELYHYGVKGMKWGVRRYQNKDGSLTASGKKRYADVDKKWTRKSQKYLPSKNQLKAMPRKERKATKRYMRESIKSSKLGAKEDYKDIKKNRQLKNDYEAYKKGEQFIKDNADKYYNALLYEDIKKYNRKTRIQAASPFITAFALASVSTLMKYNR